MIRLNGMMLGNKRFPNGELNLLDIEKAIFNEQSDFVKRNYITFKYENDAELITLMMIKKQLDVRSNYPVELTIAYMPYSRMDRAETPETPFTLKFIAEFINSLNFDAVTVYEPHSNITVELLNNARKVSLVNVFLNEMLNEIDFNSELDYIIFPDKTAKIRYDSDKFKNKLYGEKNRDFDTGKILGLNLIGDVKQKPFNAVIVDDLCSFGGTFIATAKELKKLGADKIYLLVGHCENNIFKGEIFKSGLIERVFTTDTILTDYSAWENKKYIVDKKLTVYEF